jgi:hypothetical protein
MKIAKYINRYGDKIIFKEISENEIEMLGFEYFRSGLNENKETTFIDPSGGPFISVGTDVGRYFEDGIERRIKSIERLEGKIILSI